MVRFGARVEVEVEPPHELYGATANKTQSGAHALMPFSELLDKNANTMC